MWRLASPMTQLTLKRLKYSTASLQRCIEAFRLLGSIARQPLQGSSLNDYFAWIIQRIRGLLPEPFDGQVASETRFVGYNDRAVLLL